MFDIDLISKYGNFFLLGLVLLSCLIHLFEFLNRLMVRFFTGDFSYRAIDGVVGIIIYFTVIILMSVTFIVAYCILCFAIKEITWQDHPDFIFYFLSGMGLLICSSSGVIEELS